MPSAARAVFRDIALRLPALGRLHAHRDSLLAEVERLRAEAVALRRSLEAEPSPPGHAEEFGLPSSRVRPAASYSPWEADAEFLEGWRRVVDFTAVDRYRGFELGRLVRQLGRVPGDILEVGVWKGGTGILLALAARRFLPPPCEVHLCDTYSGLVHATEADPFYRGGEFADTSAEGVRRRAAEAGLAQVAVHAGVFPQETGAALADRRFRLAHIDVDVQVSAREAFDFAWPRLGVGGVAVFDDYGFVNCAGVTRLVDQAITGRPGALVVHNLNGHALVVKTSGP